MCHKFEGGGLLLSLEIDFFSGTVLCEECVNLRSLGDDLLINNFSDAVETETLEDIKGKLTSQVTSLTW